MGSSWDDYAESWDDNAQAIAYAQQAYESLIARVGVQEAHIFDFGCGTGLLAERIAQSAREVVALDTSAKMIAVLEAKHIESVATIAQALTDEVVGAYHLADRFDLVVASSALAFVENYAETLARLRQLLKPGGHIVQWDWWKCDNGAGPGFTTEEVERAIGSAGFQQPDISWPFSMEAEEGEMTVLMAVAKR